MAGYICGGRGRVGNGNRSHNSIIQNLIIKTKIPKAGESLAKRRTAAAAIEAGRCSPEREVLLQFARSAFIS